MNKKQLSLMDVLEIDHYEKRKVENEIVICRYSAPARHERLLKQNNILLNIICEFFKVNPIELIEDGRDREIVTLRILFVFCASYLIESNTDTYISYAINVTRTVPVYYRKKYRDYNKTDKYFKIKANMIINHLTELGFSSKETVTETANKSNNIKKYNESKYGVI